MNWLAWGIIAWIMLAHLRPVKSIDLDRTDWLDRLFYYTKWACWLCVLAFLSWRILD